MGRLIRIVDKLAEKLSTLKIALRYKLLVLFFLVALPFFVFTIFAFLLINRTISNQIDSYQRAVAVSSQKIMEHYVLTCQRNLIALGKDGNFRENVRNLNVSRIRSNLKMVFDRHKTFNFLGVVGRRGGRLYFISSYPKTYKKIISDSEIYSYFERNFKHPAFRTSGVFSHNSSREIFIVYPMRGALLISGINIKDLHKILEKVKPHEESGFIILDSDKNPIIGYERQFKPIISKGTGSVIFDKKMIAHYAFNKQTGWWILLSSPYRVMYSMAIKLRYLFIIFVFLGVGVAIMLSLYFSRKVTYPIAQLNRGAMILGSGNLSYRIDLHTGDEIEGLAEEFNRMAARLKKSYDSMGEKIRVATKDLNAAYEEIDRKNKELEKSDRLKSEFLASMSHELRTPMNAIIGFTSLLEDGIYGKITEKQRQTYVKIKRNTTHLLNLINDILDLSKIEAGKMQLYLEDFNLNLLLSEIKEEIKPLAVEKGLEFNLKTTSQIKCCLDYTRIRQIIMNLISNAIKFTSSGSVTISSGIRGRTAGDRRDTINSVPCISGKVNGEFFVEVADTGIGIKEEELKNIFNEFVQADGSVTREFGGTGLGLSISKKLVDMMGGKIEVESIPKSGTVFRIILPVSQRVEGRG